MIRAHIAGKTHWVKQTEHARAAADIAVAWADPQRPRFEQELLVEATLHHDDGWASVESTQPPPRHWSALDFLELEGGRKSEIWLRGVALAEARHPYVGLLVALHAHRLTAEHDDRSAEDQQRLRLLDARAAALRERLAREEHGPALLDAAGRDVLLLGLFDALQLMTIGGLPRTGEVCAEQCFALEWREKSVTVTPWPFDRDVVELRCATVDGETLTWSLVSDAGDVPG